MKRKTEIIVTKLSSHFRTKFSSMKEPRGIQTRTDVAHFVEQANCYSDLSFSLVFEAVYFKCNKFSRLINKKECE